jgi:PIN domain nuclease of toxin-antitoxin system
MLLDTCALLWLVTDQAALTEKARQHIVKHAGSLYVSSISAFEIAIKAKKKKLLLPKDPLEWFQLAVSLHGLQEIPITAPILVAATQLPDHHQDPADRIIIATAQANKISIITADQHIKNYSSVKIVW